jgi:hypothetical protein
MSGQNKDWILRQSRAAVFFLTQCWSALWEIERLMESKGGDHWDVVDTFFKTQSMYLGRDLYSPDLSLFFDGLHELEGMERTCQRSLQESVGAEILEQLRKASWTYEQVRRIAKTIGHRTKQSAEFVLARINDLAIMADDGCQLTAEEIDIFLLGIAFTDKKGAWISKSGSGQQSLTFDDH